MTIERPTPDELLARVQAEEVQARRGKLKIFFGYAAGVGKTYAMLEAAHREKKEGVDVVIGYVEPHARPETEAMVHGLESLSPKLVQYRDVMLREFDLDAALARRPQLILVDELAHTNAEGLRHAKRWQDVEELLEAGIHVYSTLNVQHVESLNDIIGQITGVVVRETLPDSVLEKAGDIELVDLTPEELIERLKEGKVYIPRQAERALEHFFQRGNLIALRELSLRQVAQRLSRDVAAARREKSALAPWATSERLLVCVGPSPTSAKLIRSAKRMASAFGAEWLAVAVERPGVGDLGRQSVAEHLQLAESLGAETHTLVGEDVARTIIDFARAQNVTKIVVGKSAQPWWRRLLGRVVIDRLLENSGDIDIYVIRGGLDESTRRAPPTDHRPGTPWISYAWAGVIVAVCGLVGWVSHALSLTESNIVMVFLLGIAYVAYQFGRGPAVAAAITGVLVFDFFFVPPYLVFTVHDSQYVVTFAVMLVIGLLISALTVRMKDQLRTAQQIEHRSSALFQLTKQLTEIAGLEFLVQTAGRQLRNIFDGEVVIFVRDAEGSLQLRFGQDTSVARQEVNKIVAQWVADHDQTAGAGTDTLPNATALFTPLVGSQRTVGTVGVRPNDPEKLSDPELRRLLTTCASLIALSFERDQSVLEATEAELRAQAEQMRSSLLSSVSHDLRTPLAAIAGASSSLLETCADQNDTRRELLQTIADESRRMTRLVENLLEMTRLESGTIVPNKQWHVLEEIVGSALARLRRELEGRVVRVNLAPDLPLLLVDGVMFEQLLMNLFENAARYTPGGSEIEVSASADARHATIRVVDNGPGLPSGTENKIFEKFYRAAPKPAEAGLSDNRRGVGLGLAICKAIVQAHGGEISAGNRPSGGAEFVIRLPCKESPPRIILDEMPAAVRT